MSLTLIAREDTLVYQEVVLPFVLLPLIAWQVKCVVMILHVNQSVEEMTIADLMKYVTILDV